MLEKLRNRERFSFAKYGDGEIQCMVGSRKPHAVNADGHQFFPEIGERLKEILSKSPQYYIGLQSLGYRQNKGTIDQWTREFNLKWCKADILHSANMEGRLPELIEALKDRDVLLVGGEHLHQLAVKFGWYFYQIPSKDCWLAYDKTHDEIGKLVGLKDWVILYSSSFMSEILIDDFQGRATQIDTGSVFDPYAGRVSRTYHNKINDKEL